MDFGPGSWTPHGVSTSTNCGLAGTHYATPLAHYDARVTPEASHVLSSIAAPSPFSISRVLIFKIFNAFLKLGQQSTIPIMQLLPRDDDDEIINYVSPEKQVNAGLWTLFAGATVLLFLRLWVKLTRRHGLWYDDYILTASWVRITLCR